MRLVLERRAERSVFIALLSPLLAIALTLATGAALFALLGKPPIEALRIYFFDPLTDPWALQEIAVKATPLVLIGVGLSLCYLANGWNIGASGFDVSAGKPSARTSRATTRSTSSTNAGARSARLS